MSTTAANTEPPKSPATLPAVDLPAWLGPWLSQRLTHPTVAAVMEGIIAKIEAEAAEAEAADAAAAEGIARLLALAPSS